MFTIAIHGGAGSLHRHSTTQEQEEDYKKGLAKALEAGYVVLARGGSAIEAVEKSVMALKIFHYSMRAGALFSPQKASTRPTQR
ncbi:hypothetical protein DYBT9623_00162 [Dyadobacter sp. CECT 9623]|uniref:Asparaginase n=1 Tax=Dyadobacter linearis TaxID=2823330 RepID=A0ABN7QZR3_9BACT|nr:hypothetical protein DYBT9623_00162 [Dyadobacter sp. CECT 9623]